MVVVEQTLSTTSLRKLEVRDLSVVHDDGLEDRGHCVARLVGCLLVGEVLDHILLHRLHDVGLSDGGEDGELLSAEGDDRHGIGCSNMAAERVLVRDVGRDLQSRDGERGQGQSSNGDAPDGSQEVLVGRGLVANFTEQGASSQLNMSEVSDGVVNRRGSVTSGDEPEEENQCHCQRNSQETQWLTWRLYPCTC